MTARELEELMVKQFGPDFREKAIVGPVGSFPLAGVFDECGLRDPARVERLPCWGLWQSLPPSRMYYKGGSDVDEETEG